MNVHRPNWIQNIYMSVASCCGGDTAKEKRWITQFSLSTVTCAYLITLGFVVPWDPLAWIDHLWPFEPLQGSRMSGLPFVLLAWIPLVLLWNKVGAGLKDHIAGGQPPVLRSVLFVTWFFFNVFGSFYASIVLKQPFVVFSLQTLMFAALASSRFCGFLQSFGN